MIHQTDDVISESIELIQRMARPLAPEPTGVEARLRPLPGVRAVLLDIYGTLFVSGCGEVGTLATKGRARAVEGAFKATGIKLDGRPESFVEQLDETICRHQDAARNRGIDFPEIDIVAVWNDILGECRVADLKPLIVEYEMRANPAWPMPHLESCLNRLYRSDRLLAIISNAQFFTPLLFPALVGRSLEELGFDSALCYFSYQHGRAKPGNWLFRRACRDLEDQSIQPSEAVYIGNDMLNDIAGAAGVGMQTALFAGDARSLRMREGDERVAGITPDVIVTDLMQLLECLGE